MAHLIEFAEVLAVALGTYYLAALIQTVLHQALGHHRQGGKFFRAHLGNHHAIYSRIFTTKSYIDEDESLTVYYLAPVAICSALAFWLLPLPFAVTVLSAFLFSFTAHVYVHVQYHLEDSVLERSRWFRRRRYLHQLHHEQPNRNFGVMEFFWDRLLGTYTSTSIAARGQR
jgi:sterol desaturase/sphingolipid hydroxylase (fatty acid hydroxylase superfamily)